MRSICTIRKTAWIHVCTAEISTHRETPFHTARLGSRETHRFHGIEVLNISQLIKDTAARPLEAWNLKWSDIDFANSTVTITPLTHSKPRRLKLSSRTVNQLCQLGRDHAWIFGDGTLRTYQHFLRNFEVRRKEAANVSEIRG